jgi:ferrous iron transport protein B
MSSTTDTWVASPPDSEALASTRGDQDLPETVVLIGNPNVGKSVIFGRLTGRYVTVSNYPGTTVTVTRGRGRVAGRSIEFIDTPGVNSLVPMSEDEKVTRDILLDQTGAAVVQVADAKNLRRSLLVTSQLAEMGLPFVLNLNMNDEAQNLGVSIDHHALAEAIDVPVTRTVAVRKKGFGDLKKSLSQGRPSRFQVGYPVPVEEAIEAMIPLLPETAVSKRGLAVQMLSGDPTIESRIAQAVGAASVRRLAAIRNTAKRRLGATPSTAINRARLRAVDALLTTVEKRPARRPGSVLDTFGSLAMHPVWGIPVLLGVLWLVYQFVGVFGAGTLVDLLESRFFAEIVSPWAIRGVDVLCAFPHEHLLEDGIVLPDYRTVSTLSTGQEALRLIHDFLVGPYGQVTMALSYAIALILPIVATFFIAFGILEDSGYLPRLAVMVNRGFRSVGLNGKAVLPMVLGLGCDTMATLTARILETRKERIIVTLLLALGVPCSAQLGVILGMIRSLSLGATLVWAGTVFLTLIAVGWLASKLVRGESSDFILELPPIRRPQISNILVKTLARIEWYMREAVPLFLLGTFVLFLLDRFRLLGAIETAAAPFVQGVLGLPASASEAFLIGFLRRDYGAAGLYNMSREGLLDPVQLVVAMVTITLFVPCIANFFIMIKERGIKTAFAMVAVIVPLAFLVGGALNLGLRALGVTF